MQGSVVVVASQDGGVEGGAAWLGGSSVEEEVFEVEKEEKKDGDQTHRFLLRSCTV